MRRHKENVLFSCDCVKPHGMPLVIESKAGAIKPLGTNLQEVTFPYNEEEEWTRYTGNCPGCRRYYSVVIRHDLNGKQGRRLLALNQEACSDNEYLYGIFSVNKGGTLTEYEMRDLPHYLALPKVIRDLLHVPESELVVTPPTLSHISLLSDIIDEIDPGGIPHSNIGFRLRVLKSRLINAVYRASDQSGGSGESLQVARLIRPGDAES